MSNVTISEEVLVTVATMAVKEVEGVASLNAGVVDAILDKVGRKSLNGGVSVEIEEDGVVASVIINVKYGEKVHEVAKAVQENVKKAIETMTDKVVKEVNVHVNGVTVVQVAAEK